MRKFLLITLVALMWGTAADGQEILANVKINHQKLQIAEAKVFKTLETELNNLVNNTKWTEDVFLPEERLKMNFQLTIKEELSATSFSAELAVSATRPVYNSNYETLLFSHNDRDVTFTYEEFQALEFTKNSFTSNLTSIFAFYIHIALGLDYDSFSSLGGETHFQGAQEVVSNVPPNVASSAKGWRALDGRGNRNRFWLVENLLNPRVAAFRKAFYSYHRKSLDIMAADPAKARGVMQLALTEINLVNDNYPNSMILAEFLQAKRETCSEL